jgi:hypothetical protein
MSKPGPKRRKGDRYPSGKLKPEDPPAAVRRMLDLARAGAADQLLATQLGWLRVNGLLDDRQVAAGMRFAAIVGQHDRVHGLPRRATPALSYQRGFGGFGGGRAEFNPDSPDYDAEKIVAIIGRYEEVVDVLRGLDPSGKTHRLIVAVAVEDQAPEWSDRAALARGLDALARYFKLPPAR